MGNSARSRNESHVMVSRGLELHVPFTCYYRAKYTITVQEREGTGTGNHSGKKQRSGGEIWKVNRKRKFSIHLNLISMMFCYLDRPGEQQRWFKISGSQDFQGKITVIH